MKIIVEDNELIKETHEISRYWVEVATGNIGLHYDTNSDQEKHTSTHICKKNIQMIIYIY